MGRKKKYKTKEERDAAQRRWSNEYYHRNKDKINSRAMEKYYEKKYLQNLSSTDESKSS